MWFAQSAVFDIVGLTKDNLGDVEAALWRIFELHGTEHERLTAPSLSFTPNFLEGRQAWGNVDLSDGIHDFVAARCRSRWSTWPTADDPHADVLFVQHVLAFSESAHGERYGRQLCSVKGTSLAIFKAAKAQPLSLDEAVDLLASRLGPNAPSASCRTLAGKLRCIPLALALAASCISTYSLSVADFSGLFETAVAEDSGFEQSQADTCLPIIATLHTILRQIFKVDPTTMSVLGMIISLGGIDLPRSILFEQHLRKPKLIEMTEAIRLLVKLEVITIHDGYINMDPLYCLVARVWMNDRGMLRHCEDTALARITDIMPQFSNWDRDTARKLAPVAEAALRIPDKGSGIRLAQRAIILQNTVSHPASWFAGQNPSSFLSRAWEAQALRAKLFGDPEEGKIESTEDVELKAYAIAFNEAVEADPGISTAREANAAAAKVLTKLEAASVKSHGPAHARTLYIGLGLAVAQARLGEKRSARRLVEKIIKERAKADGYTSTATYGTICFLGEILSYFRDNARLRKLYKAATEQYEKELGVNNVLTGLLHDQLIGCILRTGRTEECADFLEGLPEKFDFNIDLKISLMESQALVADQLGNRSRAEAILRQVIPLMEKHWKPHAPRWVMARYKLAFVLFMQFKDKEAHQLFHLAYEGFLQSFGRDHIRTKLCHELYICTLEVSTEPQPEGELSREPAMHLRRPLSIRSIAASDVTHQTLGSTIASTEYDGLS